MVQSLRFRRDVRQVICGGQAGQQGGHMMGLRLPEILVILLIVVILFGAKRLPEIGASMGKGIREFKRSITDTQDAVMRDDSASRSMLDGGKSTTDATNTPANSGEPRRLSQ